MNYMILLQLYQNNLFSKAGNEALSYLYERGLSEDIIRQFKIGYAEDSWNQLVNNVKGKGFSKKYTSIWIIHPIG